MAEQDKANIIEALNLYAFALDTHEWSLFDSVFTEDASMDMGLVGVTWLGRAEIKEGLKNACVGLDNHQHSMTGHLVHVDGEAARAFCYGSWLLVRDATEGGRAWMGTGWYDDELVGVDGGWKIKTRVCRLISWTGNRRVLDPTGNLNPDTKMNSLMRSSEAGDLGFLKTLRGR